MQIKALSEDNFSNLALSSSYEKKRQSSSSYISPLLERTLIVLPPSFLCRQRDKSDTHGFVHVLDFLLQSKFDVCGMKMVLLSRSSAQQLKFKLSLDIEVYYKSGSKGWMRMNCWRESLNFFFPFQLEELESLPCLVLVLERDNAASCFQLITKRYAHKDPRYPIMC